MNRVKVTYLATVKEWENKPIVTAGSFDDLKAGIDSHYGVPDQDPTAKYLGWFPYESKYGDEYEGCFKYSFEYGGEEETHTVRVYCLEFHPHTVYEV